MPTHPEVVTLDPNDAEQVKRLMTHYAGSPLTDNEVPDMQKALRAMLTPPLPEEPAWWTIVRLNHKLWAIRDAITSANGGGNWLTNTGERHTWPEVCALGTPEVLEPGSVKALREKCTAANSRGARMEIERNAALSILADVEERAKEWAAADYEPANDASAATLNTTNRHGREILHILDATEDEPAEPAPVEAPPFGWVNPENTQLRLNVDNDLRVQWSAPMSDEEPVWLTLARPAVETGGQS